MVASLAVVASANQAWYIYDTRGEAASAGGAERKGKAMQNNFTQDHLFAAAALGMT